MEIAGLKVENGERKRGSVHVSELEDGTPVKLDFMVVCGKSSGPTLLVNAGVHGNEINGIEVIDRLFTEISPRRLSGAVVCVPVVNSLAFRAGERADPIEHDDMNRVFPGKQFGDTTERIARVFFTEFVLEADFCLDLHTGEDGQILMPHVRLKRHNGRLLALEHARNTGMEVMLLSDGIEGMLNREANLKGVPTVTLEIGEAGKINQRFVKAGFKGVRNCMKSQGMLSGTPHLPEKQIVCEEMDELTAEIGGIFKPAVSCGSRVREGDVLGEVHSPFMDGKVEVTAPKDGIALGIRTSPLVRASTPVVSFAGLDDATYLENNA